MKSGINGYEAVVPRFGFDKKLNYPIELVVGILLSAFEYSCKN